MSGRRTSETDGGRQPVTLSLDIGADRHALAVVRTVTESFVRSSHWHDVSDDRLREILLVLLEACGNVIRHAYGGEGEGPMRVELTLSQTGLQMRVIDHGRGFDPGRLDDLRGDPRRDLRGWGLHLMRELTDSLTVQTRAGWCIVEMTRSLDAREQARVGPTGGRS